MPRQMVAALIAVEGYDFETNSAETVLPTGIENRAEISLDTVISPCLSVQPGTPVIVDDTLIGKMLLATAVWSLIMPTQKNVPIVVETRRVSVVTPGELDKPVLLFVARRAAGEAPPIGEKSDA